MSKPSERYGNLAVGVLAICALISTGILVAEVTSDRTSTGIREITPPGIIALQPGESFDGIGERLGSADSDAKAVVIADFECPYCREFAAGPLRELLKAGESVKFIHFPLPSHRLAMPAAVAAVCAGRVGRFEAFHDALFHEQDSLGLKSFDAFAKQVGVTDITGFQDCRQSDSARKVVEQEVALARRLGVSGTPAIIVGDSLFVGVMTAELLLKRVVAAEPI